MGRKKNEVNREQKVCGTRVRGNRLFECQKLKACCAKPVFSRVSVSLLVGILVKIFGERAICFHCLDGARGQQQPNYRFSLSDILVNYFQF